jgi:hypothetical protein|tara:strand:+ start:11723 stop:12589 length:867 start_codon:yes stop_codon:yes gene_type:complete
MSNYIIQTYSRGEDLTNLLSNKIILEIEKETKNHKTNIQVINNGNFIVVRGNTTHKTPINLSKLLISYYKQLFNREINLNVVDLIEYDKLVEDEPIYINKTFIKDELTDIIKKQTYSDTLNNKDYRFTACTDLNIILTKNDFNKETLESVLNNFEDYKILKNNSSIETFKSSQHYGKNLKSSKVFESYFNYVVYNIFERGLCRDLTIEFFTEAEFDSINWENISLKVSSNSLMTSNEWLESLILDLFTFDPNEIIRRWNLDEYDFSEEIISHHNIWRIKDKVGEMILI